MSLKLRIAAALLQFAAQLRNVLCQLLLRNGQAHALLGLLPLAYDHIDMVRGWQVAYFCLMRSERLELDARIRGRLRLRHGSV